VRGVTGQEDATGPPGLGEAALEGVDDDPHQLDVLGLDPVVLLQQPVRGRGGLQVLGPLVREQGELEPLPPASDGHEHVTAGRVADLHGVLVELRGQRLERDGVDAQPALVEPEVLAGNPERLPHEALRAVGPHQVPGPQPHPVVGGGVISVAPAPRARQQRHPVAVLGQGGGAVPAVERDVVEGLDALQEGLLDVRLMNRDVVVPQHSAAVPRRDVEELAALAVDPAVLRDDPGLPQRTLDVAAVVEQPRRLAVDVRQPWLAVQRRPAFHHRDAMSLGAQQGREGEPGRAETHDQHVCGHVDALHGHSSSSRLVSARSVKPGSGR
jgi:hypothetical protein